MTYSVLLCDDEPDVGTDWHEKVRTVAPSDRYSVLDRPEPEALRDAIQELLVRQAALLADRTCVKKECLFDNANILVLDYDLVHIDENNARHTGESVARLARMFSAVEVVVVVNQFVNVQFDLSLRGHVSSHADFNISAEHLDADGLWKDPPWEGFRPWQWQTLGSAVETQRSRRALVEGSMDEPIVEVFGMWSEDIDRLSDTAFGFIAPDAIGWDGLREQTFKSFVRKRAGGRNDCRLLDADPCATYRFAAARIGKWLERLVLGPQDVLVDLPHLVQRFPFLLEDSLSDRAAWNATVGGDELVRSRIPDECWFQPYDFLSRPAVWAQRFEGDPNISKRRRSFDYSTVPPFVFLEDTSTFVPLDEATQFRAGHHNAFDRRFIKCVGGQTYGPQRRLAFAE